MNSKQLKYLLNNYKNKSIKQLAEGLDLKPKEVQRELQKIKPTQGFESPGSSAPGFAPFPAASIKSLFLGSFLITRAHDMLGIRLAKQGKEEDAIRHFKNTFI